MPQQQYVQRPYKVLAEQYTAETPLPPDTATRDLGQLCLCTVAPITDGTLHIHSRSRVWLVAVGDWIVVDLWTPHDSYVLSDAEFTDRFGPGAPLETA
jgi:hypothetical protein